VTYIFDYPVAPHSNRLIPFNLCRITAGSIVNLAFSVQRSKLARLGQPDFFFLLYKRSRFLIESRDCKYPKNGTQFDREQNALRQEPILRRIYTSDFAIQCDFISKWERLSCFDEVLYSSTNNLILLTGSLQTMFSINIFR